MTEQETGSAALQGKEISRLAREYAEQYTYHRDIRIVKEDVEDFLDWLTQHYCIVKKSEVKKLCKLIVDNASSVDYGLIDGLYDIMEDMFCEEFHEELEKERSE